MPDENIDPEEITTSMESSDALDDSDRKEKIGLKIPIRWRESNDPPILYANHMFVRLQDGTFILSFGQVELPRTVELNQEIRDSLEQEGIEIQVISRLAMPPNTLRQVIASLQKVYDTYAESIRDQGNRDGRPSARF